MAIKEVTRVNRTVTQKEISPQAVMTYNYEGRLFTRYVYMELGSMIEMIRTLKWCWHRKIAVAIDWIPGDESTSPAPRA